MKLRDQQLVQQTSALRARQADVVQLAGELTLDLAGESALVNTSLGSTQWIARCYLTGFADSRANSTGFSVQSIVSDEPGEKRAGGALVIPVVIPAGSH